MIGVIVADDNAPMRSAINEIVEAYPARIIAEAANGFDAVRAAEHEEPDLVVLDISMPVMNGLVATQHIRALYRDVPIIMITEHSEMAFRAEAYRCGALGYVLKGRASIDLPAAISSVIAGRRYTSI